jgi:hypothetical protein
MARQIDHADPPVCRLDFKEPGRFEPFGQPILRGHEHALAAAAPAPSRPERANLTIRVLSTICLGRHNLPRPA